MPSGKIIPAMMIMGLLALVFAQGAYAAAPVSPHVMVYSTYDNSSEYLYVPVNSSGLLAYPDWHVFLYGSGKFDFLVNAFRNVLSCSPSSLTVHESLE